MRRDMDLVSTRRPKAHSQSRRPSRRSMKVGSTTRFREWLSVDRATCVFVPSTPELKTLAG